MHRARCVAPRELQLNQTKAAADLRFVDQGRDIECQAMALLCRSRGVQLAQLVLDEREQVGVQVQLPSSHCEEGLSLDGAVIATATVAY